MEVSGFYIIKDEFFDTFNDKYLKGNKSGNRPHYYCFKDDGRDIFWMIPMSSRISKYQHIIDQREKQKKPCDTLHIAKLDNGKKSVFLIQDMFPVTDEYIEREYTFGGNHAFVTSEATIDVIYKKAKKVLGLLKRGFKMTPTQPDVMRIYRELQQGHEN